jgi:hypothetical protein
LERDLKNSLNTCTNCTHTTTKLATKCDLPKIDDLGKPRPDDQIQIELEVAIHSRELATGIPQRVTKCHNEGTFGNAFKGPKFNSLFMAHTKKGYEDFVPRFNSLQTHFRKYVVHQGDIDLHLS